MGVSVVSQAIRRLVRRIGQDKELKKKVSGMKLEIKEMSIAPNCPLWPEVSMAIAIDPKQVVLLLFAVILVILTGCASYLSYDRSSSNDILFHKRKPPSFEKAIIIDTNGPQLDTKYYEIMGRVMSQVSNVTALTNHCKDAIEMLRYEAESVGADALVNVSCGSGKFDASASGTAIAFKNRGEALKA